MGEGLGGVTYLKLQQMYPGSSFTDWSGLKSSCAAVQSLFGIVIVIIITSWLLSVGGCMTWRVWQVSLPFHSLHPLNLLLGQKVELAQFHSQWILKSQQQQKQMVPPMTVGFVKGEGWVTTVSCATIMYYINHMRTFDGNYTSCVTATCVWLDQCCCCRRIAFGGLAKRQTFHSNYVRGLGRMFHNQGSTTDNGIPKILQSTTSETSTIHPRKIKHANRSMFAIRILHLFTSTMPRFPPPATSCGISYLWICSLDQNAAGYFKETACARIHGSRMRSMVMESEWPQYEKDDRAFFNILHVSKIKDHR